MIGGLGPVSLVVIPPMRRWVGDEDPPKIPMTYPGESALYIPGGALSGPERGYGRTAGAGSNGEIKSVSVESANAHFAFTVPTGPRKIPEGFDDP